MGAVVDLMSRPVYGFGQVDHILRLTPGTARRWIDGYTRGSRAYSPVVRIVSTGDESVTWGEFVETRLLSEFRDAGVPMIRMRPTVERLREELQTTYPLASAKTWLATDGQEIVRRVQDAVSLDAPLSIVVRNRQGLLDWSPSAANFDRSTEWSTGADAQIHALRPVADITEVQIDPLRSFGEPVVRGVRTDIIAELVRAGDTTEMISELYELPRSTVDAAVRYELQRAHPVAAG